jgi:hypothetical protein
LIGSVHPHWIVAKSSAAVAAPIAIHLNIAVAIIPHGLVYLAPALKGFSLAIATFLRASFAFTLDIWQLQDDNRHGRLLVMAVYKLPSYKELAIFVKTHRLGYRHVDWCL